MVEIRTVRESDLESFQRLHNTYVDRDESLETVRRWYRDQPELLVGAYDDGLLVGHCLGLPRSDAEVELAGIAVEHSRQRQGIGSDLLSGFEDRAVTLGFQRISLGSAGGDVDEFYLNNGYSPESVLVRLAPDEVPHDYRDMGYEIIDEQIDNGTKKIYIGVDEYDPTFVKEIRTSFSDPDAIHIMEKDIDTS